MMLMAAIINKSDELGYLFILAAAAFFQVFHLTYEPSAVSINKYNIRPFAFMM